MLKKLAASWEEKMRQNKRTAVATRIELRDSKLCTHVTFIKTEGNLKENQLDLNKVLEKPMNRMTTCPCLPETFPV